MPRLPAAPALGILLAAAAFPAMAQNTSSVPGLEIVALDTLPPAPRSQGDRDACQHKLIADPQTAAGLMASNLGWGVTAEVPLGPLTAVSFVGGFVQGTSGSCLLTDGNLGLFSGDRLVSLVYATDPQALPIGSVEPFGTSGLRLWSGDYLPAPLADVLPTGDGMAVVPLAASEPVCNGAAQVPYVYGQPLNIARVALMQAGWQPVPYAGERTQGYGLAPDIAAAGAPEVEECSGTGFGFCSYVYAGPAGTLSVTTMGEFGEDGSLPVVAGYGVVCQ